MLLGHWPCASGLVLPSGLLGTGCSEGSGGTLLPSRALAGLGRPALAESLLQLLEACVVSTFSVPGAVSQEQEKKCHLPTRGKGHTVPWLLVRCSLQE